MPQIPDRIALGEGLSISRLICGLWQVADLEKEGTLLDPDVAADALEAYAKAGFDTFDMADHYGSAELITGRLIARYGEGRKRPVAFTKWCPEPGPMTADIVRKGVQERLDRLGVDMVDLLQFHWWTFEHPAWLDAAARDGAAEGRRADRGNRRHQFRRRPSGAGIGRRRACRHQPGFLLARRPPRGRPSFGALPRQGREAARLRHAVRRLSLRQMAW